MQISSPLLFVDWENLSPNLSPAKIGWSLWLGELLRVSLVGGPEDRFSRGEVVSTMDSWELFRRRVIPKQLRILAFRFGKSSQLRGLHTHL